MSQDQTTGQAVAIIGARLEPPANTGKLLESLGIDATGWSVMVNTIYPGAKDPLTVLQALQFCKKRNLDPFKRPIHIVPTWSDGGWKETIWEGINSVRITAMRTREFVGTEPTEFGPTTVFSFSSVNKKGGVDEFTVKCPEWARVTVRRKIGDHVAVFPGPTIFFMEFYAKKSTFEAVPNDRWRRAPGQMLEKCAEAAALRKAFPEELGGLESAEEHESEAAAYIDHEPLPDMKPTRLEVRDAIVAESVDPITGEVIESVTQKEHDAAKSSDVGSLANGDGLDDIFPGDVDTDNQLDKDGLRVGKRRMIDECRELDSLKAVTDWAAGVREMGLNDIEKSYASHVFKMARAAAQRKESGN